MQTSNDTHSDDTHSDHTQELLKRIRDMRRHAHTESPIAAGAGAAIAPNRPAGHAGTLEACGDDSNSAIRTATVEALYRCVDRMLIALAREHERCGKAACARARRCRGFACAPAAET